MVAGAAGEMGPYGTSFTISIPVPFSVDPSGLSTSSANPPTSHGFAVQFVNGISSIKYNHGDLTPFFEDVQLLDPAPAGSGEWVTITAPKWDYCWVSPDPSCIKP